MRAVALLVLALPVALAGCLNEHAPPHHLRVLGLDVQPARVLSSDVVLNVTASLDNRGGGETGDVRLGVKAYSEEKGFLLAENESRVGVLPGDTTRAVSIHVTVPREGSARVEVTVFEDDQGQLSASVTARNLQTLEPEVFDTGLRISDVDFLVQRVDGNGNASRATIQTDLYLTNEGDDVSENLRLQVKAREISTRLVADVQWLETGGVQAGATVIRSVNLTVPDRYNYAFEILTWRGDVIIARSQDYVQLAPTFEKPKDTEVVTTDANVRDFLSPTMTPDSRGSWNGAAGGSYSPTPSYEAGTPAPRVPGFTAAAVALAVGAALLLARRRSA
ncbi:MAG TPA: hypothetical protein VNX21_01470 [Candidatus Thermoplasmatota archaeon]|nr:hypothetical protein [Candidatus Thermoplasmatota archaeon]